MASSIGELLLRLRLNTSELASDLAQSGRQITASTQQWSASLTKLNGPINSVQTALGRLGVEANSASGEAARMFSGIASAAGKAGLWGVAIGGVALAIHQVAKASEETRKTEAQFQALSKTFGVTSNDVQMVRRAFGTLADELDRKTAQALILAGSEAKLTTAEMVAMAGEVKRLADLTGKSIPEVAKDAFGKFKNEAAAAVEELNKLLDSLEQRLSSKPAEMFTADKAVEAARKNLVEREEAVTTYATHVDAGMSSSAMRGLSMNQRLALQATNETALAAALKNRADAEATLAQALTKREAIQAKLDELDDKALEKAAFQKAAQLQNAELAKSRKTKRTKDPLAGLDPTGGTVTADDYFAAGMPQTWEDPSEINSEYARRNANAIAAMQNQIETFAMSDADRRRTSFLAGMPTEEELGVFDELNARFEQLRAQEALTDAMTRTLAATFSDFLVQPLLHGVDGLQTALDGLLSTLERIVSSIAENAILLALGASTGGIGGAILGALGFAEGGFVSGPGGPKSDAVPAWLSNGEYVMPAEAVQNYGRSFMDAIRDRAVPRFAGGGLVGVEAPAPSLAAAPGIGPVTINALSPKTTREVLDDLISRQQARRYYDRSAGLETAALARAMRAPRSR